MGDLKANQDIIVTGGAGFIGSCFAKDLLKRGLKPEQLIVVDSPAAYRERKCTETLRDLPIRVYDSNKFLSELEVMSTPAAVFHLGASSSTEEMRVEFLKEVNVDYSKSLWNFCKEKSVPFFYASSAATYGDGKKGFDDDPKTMAELKPLNPYGRSKLEFDLWALEEAHKGNCPPRWAGFKFFNVYGPGEEHKGSQASVLWSARRQLRELGHIKLFQSHHPDFEDGMQQRDFIWVEDINRSLRSFFEKSYSSGIYNLGTGRARSFVDLAKAICAAEKKECEIVFIPTPEHLREHYQYFTEAKLDRLRASGYDFVPSSLEEGVEKSILAISSKH